MNKAAIALAIVAAIAVSVASANKFHSHHVQKDHDFEHENHHPSEFEYEDGHHEIDDNPCRRCQQHNFNHHSPDHHEEGHRHNHGHIRKHFSHAKSHHGKGNSKHSKRGHLRGVGGSGVGVAGGNFREHEGQSASFEKNTRLADRNSIQGKKGFVAGENKGVDIEARRNNNNENAGIHKHQVVNRNRVVIKDQENGVNDVDGFRNSREESESGRLAANEGKFFAGGASGKITNEKELEHGVRAAQSSEDSSEGAGFVAGAGTGGAGEFF